MPITDVWAEMGWFGDMLFSRQFWLLTANIFRIRRGVPRKGTDNIGPLDRSGHHIRVWTQLHQHLIAYRCSIARKLPLSFSKRTANRRISFMLQKKRSTILRILYRVLSWAIGFLEFDFEEMTARVPIPEIRCRISLLP